MVYLRMKKECTFAIIFVTLTALFESTQCYNVERYSLLMPNVKPNIVSLFYDFNKYEIEIGNYATWEYSMI